MRHVFAGVSSTEMSQPLAREERAADPSVPGAVPGAAPQAQHWLLDEENRGKTPEEIIGILLKRVPHLSSLRDAQKVLNELGRLPHGGRLIRQVLTQSLLMQLSGEKR